MKDILDLVDVGQLRKEVQSKYREVAENPHGQYHFQTGRAQATRLGYPRAILDQLPEEACEAFAGVGNPFFWDTPKAGERVLDLGSGAGMDSFFAARCVGANGKVIGVDMTPHMLERGRRLAQKYGFSNVEFREGLIEDAPVEDGWADVVISNGVFNLCPDKLGVYRQVARCLRPGGRMMVADICVDKPIPESALRDIDLWTG
jgi:SAM-dependent methyltransferase